MPTILPPDEHLTAGLTAVQKHIDYHEGELAALRGLRRQYKDALGIMSGDRVHVEQTPVEAITVVGATSDNPQPTFDELVATMSGRIQQP